MNKQTVIALIIGFILGFLLDPVIQPPNSYSLISIGDSGVVYRFNTRTGKTWFVLILKRKWFEIKEPTP